MHLLFIATVLLTLTFQESFTSKTLPGIDASVRLVGGATRCSGQVQVYQGEWINLYRTHWGEAEGHVVCRQLGCGDLVSPNANYKDKASAYPVWSELVSCKGDELTLMNCSHSRNASDSLGPETYRAAVACHQDDLPNAPEPMAVRLINGTTPNSGRVEIYYNGEWGTICGLNSWSLTDGHVVCRQLGYASAVAVKGYMEPFGRGYGSILLSFVDCDGHEEKLGNCRHEGWYRHNCDHYYDVGVICKTSNETGIRLVDGPSQYEGRVELYYNGEWGTICDDGWGIEDARVVCRQLGYGPAISTGRTYSQGQGAILQSDVNCHGWETSIMDCDMPRWYPSAAGCHHHEDAGVKCDVPEDPSVRVRLTHSFLDSEGQVEVYHNGEWGTACSNSFTIWEADVVCRQLGYRKALKVLEPGRYGDAELIILDNVQCDRASKTLADCQGLVWYPTHSDCLLQHTAGVMCDINIIPDTVSSVKVRLTGGAVESEGQVELFYSNQWGTVCASGFDMNAATVVCRQLGYNNAMYLTTAEEFSDGSRPLLLDSVNCRSGTEENIARCGPLEWYRHDWHNCQPAETAAVACHGSKIGGDMEVVVRLSNGTQASNGRVDVYHHGQWGSVCGAGLGRNEAQVICRQLGYRSGEPVEQFGLYGSGAEQVSMWALTCTGEEILVDMCTDIEWYDGSKHVCDKHQTAGVVCKQADGKSKSPTPGPPVYAVVIIILLSIIAVVLLVVLSYCVFLKRSKRNAAATQMRYAVLDKQDNSTAY